MVEHQWLCIRHQDRIAEYMYNGNSYCKECVKIYYNSVTLMRGK